MASKKQLGTPVVIVESPAKARTIGKFLGSDYRIEASIGHIRDLPGDASEVPAELKKEKWAKLGIDVEHDFKALYVVPADKKDHLKKLKAMVKDASILYLATDEDREGESISWHLVQELEPKCETKRLVFHEITKPAILEALANPRQIDMDLVEAQETRRLVDRLYGYTVSPLLWKKIKPKLSAGRVQSVAVRLIVERERERMRFQPAEYWTLDAVLTAAGEAVFPAALQGLGQDRVATGRDFDPDTGKLKAAAKGLVILGEQQAKGLAAELQGRAATVLEVDQKPYVERPYPPFTTSTLQQEAARKLRYAAARTMRAAQRLYENGFITYMRTDSTTLSTQAIAAARALIEREFGAQYLPEGGRQYSTKVKNAQEAHEAIRPAGAEFVHPSALPGDMGPDERAVYDLIWRRTVASQMKDARGQRTTMTLGMPTAAHGQARFTATGKTIEFPGYRLAYIEDLEDADSELAEQERVLPDLKKGQQANAGELKAAGHTTQPPPRISEAGLIKELEARGIGRPSTYAAIIETIVRREYVFKKGTALVPTFTAFAVVDLLASYLGFLVDYQFTAKMEDDLDEISNGKAKRIDYLTHFFLGEQKTGGAPGLRDRISGIEGDIDPRKVCSIPLGTNEAGELVEVRVGRYGPFLSCGDKRAPVPDETPPDEMTLARGIELLKKGGDGPKVLGTDPATGLQVFVKVGRFGPYFQLGELKVEPKPKKGKKGAVADKPKMASLLAGMEPETVTLEQALATLALPRTVGTAVTAEGTQEPILAANGRFGPYLKWGKETRSIPAGHTPLSVDLALATALFAQPKTGGRGRKGAPSQQKARRELGESPVTKTVIKLLDGRYGPYVTDGTTNASLNKDENPDELTLVRALELLAARAAKGPAPKKRSARRPKKAASS
ncbi:MAG: type I DNA topoisomerase [Planctomycetes bacterium]|jgi:DNA topoisomerase-1|nr:type I DNA topoisomerase [Planctomycetota bacterium]